MELAWDHTCDFCYYCQCGKIRYPLLPQFSAGSRGAEKHRLCHFPVAGLVVSLQTFVLETTMLSTGVCGVGQTFYLVVPARDEEMNIGYRVE